MKKLIALMLVAFAVFALCACGGTDDEQAEGKATIVVYSSEPTKYTVDLSELEGEKTVLAAMEYLNENKGVALTYSTSEYGAYVTEFASLKSDPLSGKYIGFHTSVKKDWDISATATEKYYMGTRLITSGVGVSSAALVDEAIIYFDYIIYSF